MTRLKQVASVKAIVNRVYKARLLSLLSGLLVSALITGCSVMQEGKSNPSDVTEDAQQQLNVERLLGQKWRLLSIQAEGIEADASGTKVSLAFNTDKQQVYGFAGCNNYFGQYTVTDNSLVFGYLGMTRKMCHTGMELEGKFGRLMSKVASYSFEDNKLHFYDSDKRLLAILTK
ncbi:MAG: hypothetical protein CL811_04030 [Colwelliaceae bacterium]|nr:hypothetical protein [Colwelliaceae bacterium]